MPLHDYNERLETDLDMTGLSVGNNYASNSIDLLTNRDIGQGCVLFLCMSLSAAAVNATGSLSLSVVTADGVDGSGVVNSGNTNVVSLQSLQPAALLAGTEWYLPIPPQLFSRTDGLPSIGKRYLSANLFVNTAVFTAGTLSLRITDNAGSGRTFPAIGAPFS